MKTLVVYDSMYGNTEKIARAIGEAAAAFGDTKVPRASEANASSLESIDVLFLGAPTQGGKPTKAVLDFLARLPESAVKGLSIAVFDTRLPARWVRIFGFAAGKMDGALKKRGVSLIAPPEGFIVKGKEGPLADGELERAASWARGVLQGKSKLGA